MSNLKVNVKDHKLNCNPEILQNIRPVFNVSASSYSCTTKQRRINSEPIEDQPRTQQITSGLSQQQSGSQIQKPSESNLQKSPSKQNQQIEQHHEDKTSVDITMRDGNTGEFLARGHLEFDPSKKKETKYDEKVTLKDLWGNEVGYANVDIEQEKLNEKDLGFDDQFRHMRREMKQMMRDTNRLFGNFSKRFLGRNYGFDLLDDFRSMMLEDQPFSGWNPSLENEPRSQQSGGTQQQLGSQQKSGSQQQQQQYGSQQQQKGSQQQYGSQQGSQSQKTQSTGTQEDMTRRTQDKKGNVEITEEKPIA